MSDAGTDAGAAKFAFSNISMLVEVDELDNPDGHLLLNPASGTQVSFAIANEGSAAGTAEVVISVDGQQAQTWTSPEVPPNGSVGPPGAGFVHGCGRYTVGLHNCRLTVNPGILADTFVEAPFEIKTDVG